MDLKVCQFFSSIPFLMFLDVLESKCGELLRKLKKIFSEDVAHQGVEVALAHHHASCYGFYVASNTSWRVMTIFTGRPVFFDRRADTGSK